MVINADTKECHFGFQIPTLQTKMLCLQITINDPTKVEKDETKQTISTPFRVVKEKLAITEQPPDVWFKDEGGRDKCMTVKVTIQCPPGNKKEDRIIL